MDNPYSTDRIVSITLDDASIIRRTPEVEHERRVAIADLIDANIVGLTGEYDSVGGPYALFISVREGRLTCKFTGKGGEAVVAVKLAPFRMLIKDYFLMCEGYYDAIRTAPADKIQTLDMARRAVHNEGSEMLQSQLSHAVVMDFASARRLFTLICVLHIK
jgi:uncharacterized protein (UPF0262 family)